MKDSFAFWNKGCWCTGHWAVLVCSRESNDWRSFSEIEFVVTSDREDHTHVPLHIASNVLAGAAGSCTLVHASSRAIMCRGCRGSLLLVHDKSSVNAPCPPRFFVSSDSNFLIIAFRKSHSLISGPTPLTMPGHCFSLERRFQIDTTTMNWQSSPFCICDNRRTDGLTLTTLHYSDRALAPRRSTLVCTLLSTLHTSLL